jgi:ssRNA-specific RNase YbeY (16S rRNA maturation enzyme)
MKLNAQKTDVISFTHKTNSIHFDYHLGNTVITRTDCVKDSGVWLDNKLYFHHHVNYMLSVASKLLGLN